MVSGRSLRDPGNGRSKNYWSASVFAAKEYEMPLPIERISYHSRFGAKS
jgi:hypothetical protein